MHRKSDEMEDKIIVKSELKDAKGLCMMLPVFAILIYIIDGYIASDTRWGMDFAYGFGFGNGANYVFIPMIFIFVILGYIIYLRWSKVELVVTDKRVYGNDALGKRVDLPLDSITAIATSMFSGLAVTTASGAIKFVMIKNRDEIHAEISKLLVGRQETGKVVSETIVKQEISQSNADELKKFKDLLDSGVITQEEFDAKKKQLLGL